MSPVPDSTDAAEKRASLYWWFATVFAAELNAQQIAVYSKPETADYLQALAEEAHLQAGVKELQSAIGELNFIDEQHLELAADFASLFLTGERSGATPCASVYLSQGGLMFQQPHEQMLDLLEASGLAVDDEFREPADHIAIQLDYLGNLVMKTVAAKDGPAAKKTLEEQLAFIEQHLLSWVLQFCDRCQRIRTKTGFYQATARLLVDYLVLDQAYLVSVLQPTDERARDFTAGT